MDVAEFDRALASPQAPVDAAASLLRFCYQRDRGGSWSLPEGSEDWAHDIGQDVDAWLRRNVPFANGRPANDWLDRDAVGQLRAALAGIPGDVEPADVAISLARVLDDHYGERYADRYRPAGSLTVEEGVVFPVEYPDLRSVVQGKLSAPPWALPRARYWTKHLRVGEAIPPGFTLELDFGQADMLSGLRFQSYRVATLHPNSKLSEFGRLAGRKKVFPVVPTDMTRQREVLGSLVETALSGQAEIVVVAELAVDEQASRDVARRAIDGGALVVVPGSYHERRGDARVNGCDLFLGDSETPAVRHEKFHPLEAPIREDITRVDPRIRCLAGGGWRIAVCVCRDLLDQRVINAMVMLGCNLVVVPSMSDDLGSFRGFVESLVSGTQAIVVVANNPMLWDLPGSPVKVAARLAFGHPRPEPMELLVPQSAAPGIGWLEMDTGNASYEPQAAGG